MNSLFTRFSPFSFSNFR